MKLNYFLIALLILLSTRNSKCQTLNANWKQDLTTSLQQILECQANTSDQNISCFSFVGKSVNTVYKVNDFYSQQSGRYMTVVEIAKFLKENKLWTALGLSYDQKTLDKAQEYANAKKAVVAVFQNAQGLGHVVLITPGQLQLSGSWGLKVPTVASFFPTEPDKSFMDKPLSFAFSKNMIKDVIIYGRNY